MDVYLQQHPVSGRTIYLPVLFALVTVLVALPFIYVDVSVQDIHSKNLPFVWRGL